MSIEQQLIFLFSALGGVNGALLSSYFLFKRRNKRLSDYFLGGLLLMLSVRTIKSVFLFFNPKLFEFFIQFGLAACLLIGPFLMLYVMSMTTTTAKIRTTWWWNTLPYLMIIAVFSYQYSYYEHRQLWNQFIELIYKQWFVYIAIAGYLLRSVFKKIWTKKRLEDHEFWLMNIFTGTFIVWLAYETSYYTSYIVGALSFTFLLYTAILLWFYKSRNKKIADDQPLKYRKSTLNATDVQRHQAQLEQLMQTEKPYLNADLTLEKLASQLHISRKELSQVINQATEKNYAQYIAHLRVEAAKKLLATADYQHLKIAAIAYESGFNSLSSFNSHFKKVAGITANEFRKQQMSKS